MSPSLFTKIPLFYPKFQYAFFHNVLMYMKHNHAFWNIHQSSGGPCMNWVSFNQWWVQELIVATSDLDLKKRIGFCKWIYVGLFSPTRCTMATIRSSFWIFNVLLNEEVILKVWLHKWRGHIEISPTAHWIWPTTK